MIEYKPIVQSLFIENMCRVDVLRLDLLDAEISGNKWFKLKNNLQAAKEENFETLITFGGSHSNHIAATAAAARRMGFSSVGIIRGEEPRTLNGTLEQARMNGMRLHFISRQLYAQKAEPHFRDYLHREFGRHYLIPEGGNNIEGAKGCTEILREEWEYDYICCACGTATTFAGMLASVKPKQKVIGISVLRGANNLPAEAEKLLKALGRGGLEVHGNEELLKPELNESLITNAYSFSGYAGYSQELVLFKAKFEKKFSIPLDHIYTIKLFYGVTDLLERKKLKKGSAVLIVHSGGLQGNKGFEERYHLKLMR